MIHTKEQTTKTTTFFKLLSDPTRVRILLLLGEHKSGLCVHEIAGDLGISHSAASHQLAKLEARGITESFRQGQSVCYELQKNKLTENLINTIKLFSGSSFKENVAS